MAKSVKYFKSADRDYYLWHLLGQARTVMYRYRHKTLRSIKKYRITPRKYAVMFAIDAIGDKATPAEISRWLLREPHSISELLKRMVKEGLLKKAKDLDKRNMVRVELTDKGREAFEYASNDVAPTRILSVLSKAERQRLWRYLLKIRDKAAAELGLESEMPFPPLE